MGAITNSLSRTVIVGFILAAIICAISYHVRGFDAGNTGFWSFIFRWIHVLSGVMWIGLLWYFNFVQTPSMPKIPAEHKPAITKVIAPEALFWFRWGAVFTLVSGLILAYLQGYIEDALLLGTVNGTATMIGIGMWMAIIMFFNVWVLIWPNQKKVLGIVQADADAVAKAAKIAGMASRINTLLSIGMLYCMVAQTHLA
jgi:uncharacterized membrane protein